KDYKCPLCVLAAGGGDTISGQQDVIYHDDVITAFVAGKFVLSNPGHVIIIPNNHFENLYDIDEGALGKVHALSKKVALGLKKEYNCDGVSIRQHNEPAGNQDVWHYHLHVVPRYKDDHFYEKEKETKWATFEEKKPYVEKLRKYFKNI